MRVLWVSSSLMIAAGCLGPAHELGSDGGGFDSGLTTDAGVRADAGLRADAGPDVDAGLGTDAGFDAGPSGSLTFQVPPGFDGGAPAQYPLLQLRGYGWVSGQNWSLVSAAGPASVLLINLEDAPHAALTHAKYLSDLQSLGGVTAQAIDGNPGWKAGQQGALLALSSGRSVAVLTGPTPAEVTALYRALQGPSTRSFQAAVPVPAYLDRFDKHAFNFYHSAGAALGDVDPLADFDYASAHGGTGFALWDPVLADGQTGSRTTLWALSAAEARGLPVVLNTGALAYNLPRFLRDRYQGTGLLPERAPGFHGTPCGTQRGDYFGECILPWGGGPVEDDALGTAQVDVRTYGSHPNVVSILEPHGEMSATATGVLAVHGPAADAKFQAFLQTRYPSVTALGTAWFSDPAHFSSWSQVGVPELADFAGRDATALDIAGPWRMLPTAGPGTGTLPWVAPGFDDSGWAPVAGDDHLLMMPQGAVALRTSFTAGPTQGGLGYLYVWSLNWGCPPGAPPRAFLDGTELPLVFPVAPRAEGLRVSPQWMVFGSASAAPGNHALALATAACTGGSPLAYRVYLSSTAPRQFPQLSRGEDARWVDFMDWYAGIHGTSVAHGMEMIRQTEPDKMIELMAPNQYSDLIKANAEDWGGVFHDTGFMAAVWIDLLPSLMRSSGMAATAEPGGPATTVPEFKRQVALWLTEGVNGINYFLQIGNVIDDPAIEAQYRLVLPALLTLGKHHIPKGQVAQLVSHESQRLQGFPWGDDPNLNQAASGGAVWALSPSLSDEFDLDALTELDFPRGNAASYRVIIDGNTSFMTAQTVAAIEAWVRAGGTFVTFVQTGRHGEAGANSWPISSLTGYAVQSVDPYAWGVPAAQNPLVEVPGQTLLSHRWGGHTANGLHLRRVATDAQDILRWSDGTTAVGVRKVGAGQVVALGAKFSNEVIWWGGTGDTRTLFEELITQAGIPRVQGDIVTSGTSKVIGSPTSFRHSVSNNGLYDVWTLAGGAAPSDVDLRIRTGTLPSSALDVLAGSTVALVSSAGTATLPAIHLDAMDTRVYVTAKNALAQAPQAWFELQEGWWKGTHLPRAAPYEPPSPNRINFGPDFPLEVGAAGKGYSATVSIPSAWAQGRTELWVEGEGDPVFLAQGTASVDGAQVGPSGSAALRAVDVTAQLPPGAHTVRLDVTGQTGAFSGVRGLSWLRHIPAPLATLDLGGTWQTSVDGLSFGGGVTVPGPWSQGGAGIMAISRGVLVPAAWRGNRVVLNGTFQACTGATDLFINGRWFAGAGTFAATPRLEVDVTSAIDFGKTNAIQLQTFLATPATCQGTAVQSLQLVEAPP